MTEIPLQSLLGEDLLTTLLGGSHPPDLAAPQVRDRLEILIWVVAQLRGTYNEAGIRRWFTKHRSQLRGAAPIDILCGEWSPEDRRVQAVCQLAAQSTGFVAT